MADEDNRFRSYASRVSTKAKENKSSGSSGFKSSSGSQNRNDNARKSNNEKQADQLAKLQNQGQANSVQAKLIKEQLARSDAKKNVYSQKLGRNLSFDEKMDLVYGDSYTAQETGKSGSDIGGYMQDYFQTTAPKLDKYGLPAAKLDMAAMKFGDYDMSQPMATGFGSVFGSSSGSTASSPTVQKSLLEMMGQYYGKYDYTPQEAADAAFGNFYPVTDIYDFSGPPGQKVKGYANLMPQAQTLEDFKKNFPDHYTMEEVFKSDPKRYGGTYGRGNYYGGSYGGYSGGSGSGGGGGGSSGGYGGRGYGSGSQVYQRGQVGPGSLQEQVNQAYLSGGKGFSRGGIVSLLRL